MESCIYEGSVRHRRHDSVEHTFTFPFFMLYLDLAEVPRLFRGCWLWTVERRGFASFRRRDHMGNPRRPLDQCVRDLVQERTGQRPEGPIRLLTHLRYAGYAMNPISLYYCFDREGRAVENIVAEVNNTPWGEQHCYVLSFAADPNATNLRALTPKQMHVSPFMAMDLSYEWRFGPPGPELGLDITNLDARGRRIFDAALRLTRSELTAGSRARVLIRYPLVTLQLILGIYWQALRLRLKGARFHPHPHPRAGEASLEMSS